MKPIGWSVTALSVGQPPSGGCVLKQLKRRMMPPPHLPAAFGRLCVETMLTRWVANDADPAAFGRLCVETITRKSGF